VRSEEPADEGTITLLVVGFTFVALLLALLVLNVSVVFLARRDLVGTADGAALAAAQRIDLAAFYAGGAAGGAVPLDEAAAAAAVAGFEDGETRIAGVAVEGDTVTVTVTRDVDLPFGGLFGLESWRVEAVATARSPLR
jgi:hypothetical protein